MSKCRIAIKADRAGIRRKALPVFFLVQDLISENADGRCAAAYRYIADQYDLPESRVYRDICHLVERGWLEADTKSRMYKMLRLGRAYMDAVGEADFEAENEAENFRKNQYELSDREAAVEAEKNATGVTGVRVLPLGVDVPVSGLEEDLQISFVASSEATPEPVPYDRLREAYNQRRGALPEARPFSEPARKKIRTRWRAHSDMEFWKTLFDKAGKSQTMVTWADLHWLMKSELNIEKTLNGNYDNDRAHRVAPSMRPAVRRYSEAVVDEAELPDAAFLLEHRIKHGLAKVSA